MFLSDASPDLSQVVRICKTALQAPSGTGRERAIACCSPRRLETLPSYQGASIFLEERTPMHSAYSRTCTIILGQHLCSVEKSSSFRRIPETIAATTRTLLSSLFAGDGAWKAYRYLLAFRMYLDGTHTRGATVPSVLEVSRPFALLVTKRLHIG